MKFFIKLYGKLDHSDCDVDTTNRLFAYVIDYLVGKLWYSIPIGIIWLYYTKNLDELASDIVSINHELGYGIAMITGVLALLFGIFYYVVIPYKIYPGQTLGKRFMGFKIVHTNDREVTLKTLIIRQFIGIILIEGFIYAITGVIREMIALSIGNEITQVLTIAGIIITGISCFLVVRVRSHRMLHDYMAKTKVVSVKK